MLTGQSVHIPSFMGPGLGHMVLYQKCVAPMNVGGHSNSMWPQYQISQTVFDGPVLTAFNGSGIL